MSNTGKIKRLMILHHKKKQKINISKRALLVPFLFLLVTHLVYANDGIEECSKNARAIFAYKAHNLFYQNYSEEISTDYNNRINRSRSDIEKNNISTNKITALQNAKLWYPLSLCDSPKVIKSFELLYHYYESELYTCLSNPMIIYNKHFDMQIGGELKRQLKRNKIKLMQNASYGDILENSKGRKCSYKSFKKLVIHTQEIQNYEAMGLKCQITIKALTKSKKYLSQCAGLD